jgi:hypothetical protein
MRSVAYRALEDTIRVLLPKSHMLLLWCGYAHRVSARAIQYELLGDRHRPRPVRSPRRGEGVRHLAVRSLRHPLRRGRRQRRDGRRAGTAVPALQSTARTGAATGTTHPLPSPVAPRWLTRTRRTSMSPSGSWHSSPVARNGCSPSTGDYPTGGAAAASPSSRCGRAPSRTSRCKPSRPGITAASTEVRGDPLQPRSAHPVPGHAPLLGVRGPSMASVGRQGVRRQVGGASAALRCHSRTSFQRTHAVSGGPPRR